MFTLPCIMYMISEIVLLCIQKLSDDYINHMIEN